VACWRAFTPAQVTLKAGKPVTLTVVNVGRATHMFTSTYLASQDLEIESADIKVDAPKGVKYVGRALPSRPRDEGAARCELTSACSQGVEVVTVS
jgi:hypothetical protein